MISEVSVHGQLGHDEAEYHGRESVMSQALPLHGKQEAELMERGRDQRSKVYFRGTPPVTYFLQLSPTSKDSNTIQNSIPAGDQISNT
jgi:hypothetical protein